MLERQKNFITRMTGGRLHRSHYIAIGIAVAIGLWFMTGIVGGGDSNGNDLTAAEADAANNAATRVRVAESTAAMRQSFITIRGRTEAKRAVEVRAETQGTVTELPVEKGERVKEGDVLCRLKLDARDAQLAEAKALVKQRQLEYDASRQLAEKGWRALDGCCRFQGGVRRGAGSSQADGNRGRPDEDTRTLRRRLRRAPRRGRRLYARRRRLRARCRT